jgi:hypothetical protein
MITAADFKVGDYVEHFAGRNIGRVVEIKPDGSVQVKFDRGRDHWDGCYDNLWFRMHPDGLKKIDPPMFARS